MHEVSIAHDIFSIIADTLGQTAPLDAVQVSIGPLSGISPEALEFCFMEVGRERGFGAPRLDITRTTARMRCRSCGHERESCDFYDLCPRCGAFDRDVLSGREFQVVSVEMKEESHV